MMILIFFRELVDDSGLSLFWLLGFSLTIIGLILVRIIPQFAELMGCKTLAQNGNRATRYFTQMAILRKCLFVHFTQMSILRKCPFYANGHFTQLSFCLFYANVFLFILRKCPFYANCHFTQLSFCLFLANVHFTQLSF